MNWWDKLTKPPSSINLTEMRRQARLFSALTLCFIPLAAANLLFLLNFDQINSAIIREPAFLLTLIGNMVCWFAYGLSRTRYYQAGIILFTTIVTLLIIASVIIEPQHTDTLYWFILPILLTSMLLSQTRGIIAAFLHVVVVLLLPLVVPQITYEYALFAATLLATISVLLLLFAGLRRQDLAKLQQEREYLALVSDDLRQIQNELEQRIEQRTEDIATTNQALQKQIVERQQTETLLAERNRELTLLNGVLEATTSNLDIEQVLAVACRELAHTLKAPRCSAALLTPDKLGAKVIAEYLSEGDSSIIGVVLPLTDTPILAQVLEDGNSVMVENVQEKSHSPAIKQLLSERQAISILALPLFIGDEVAGSIGLSRNEAGSFTVQEVTLASSIAAAVSQSLYAAHLFTAEREQRNLAEALLDTAMALNRSRALGVVLDRVQTNISRVIPHDSGNIMLLEKGIGRVVRCWGYSPESEAWMKQFRFSVDDWTTFRAMLNTRQTYLVADVANHPGWVTYGETVTIRSHMGAPLLVDEQIWGFVHVDSLQPYAFTPLHADHLQAFANQVALALHNTHLHEQMERHAELLEQKVVERTADLAHANEELRALAQVKDEFVAHISHELRTPITNLILRQALIERMPEKQAKHLDVMRRETLRLNRIIEDLLQLSRLDRGRVALDLVALDLNALVAQYVMDRLPMAENLGLTLTLGQRLYLPSVEGDEEMLGQVLSVLLTNALNYTPAGGRVDVRTHLQEESGQMWIGFSITDTGPGIPLAEQSKLFERFYRGSAAQAVGVPGTGLGLALAKEIMVRHRGRITMSSSGIAGEGCVFAVWLPRIRPELVEEEE